MKLHLERHQIPPHLLKYFKSIEPKRKDDLMLPHRFYQAMMENGWYGRCDIVWQKVNCMPESVGDRPTRSHEYVFLFSKNERYFYDAAAIAEPAKTLEDRPDKIKRHKRGDLGRVERIDRGLSGAQHRWASAGLFDGDGSTRNARSVWPIPTSPLPDEHYAPMPQALAERCIKAGSRPGDTVLDPFAGSGTTGRAALTLQRSAVLIDLAYAALQERRTDGVQVQMVELL